MMAISLLQYDLSSSMIIILSFSIVLLGITYRYLYRKYLFSDGKITAPEASGGWPIIGHLLLLKGPTPSHKTLGDLAEKHGPIFAIRIGSHRGLVVSNSEIAKECFTTNDLTLASRPVVIAGKHFGYDQAMLGFTPYGPYWREIRKIVSVELISNRRLDMLKHVRVSELAVFTKELHQHWLANQSQLKVMVEMKKWLSGLALNVNLTMLAGKRYSWTSTSDVDMEESRVVLNAITEFFNLVGQFLPGDAIPWLAWLDLGGYEKLMKRCSKDMDCILSQWLKEHKLKSGERDFMDVMLSVLDGSCFAGFDADTIIKATIMNLLAASSDTATTLTWAISLLLNNPNTLKKAQDELDRCVGKTRVVDVSDITELIYIQCIVKETLRLYSPATLSGPHLATKDCTIGGYHVPKDTRVIANLWKIQTDPVLWPEPLEFRPERFQMLAHRDVDVRGHHFELIPFGSGRRSCPGISFAIQMVQFTLARFLQGFDISTLLNASVDMTESFGLSNFKTTPLDVLITPRLSAELYG